MQASAPWDKATVLHVRRRSRRVTSPISRLCFELSGAVSPPFRTHPPSHRTRRICDRRGCVTGATGLGDTARTIFIIIATTHVVAGTQDRGCGRMRRQPQLHVLSFAGAAVTCDGQIESCHARKRGAGNLHHAVNCRIGLHHVRPGRLSVDMREGRRLVCCASAGIPALNRHIAHPLLATDCCLCPKEA